VPDKGVSLNPQGGAPCGFFIYLKLMAKKETTTNTEEKEERVQHYELVYLISNKFSENELEPIAGAVVNLIKDNGGTIATEENWGKKKLAYPIKNFFHAYYVAVEFDLPRANLNKLEHYLHLHEDIIRHLIVQKRIKSASEIANEKRAAQQMAEEEQAKLQAAAEPQRKPADRKIKKEEKKVSMDELDEKLNKILDDTESLL